MGGLIAGVADRSCPAHEFLGSRRPHDRRIDLQRLSAFPLTPADADGVVDTDALALMLDRLVAAGVDSIAVLGSTGTYAYLDRSERARALAAAVEAVAGRVR